MNDMHNNAGLCICSRCFYVLMSGLSSSSCTCARTENSAYLHISTDDDVQIPYYILNTRLQPLPIS
jgi:hypothetical protein